MNTAILILRAVQIGLSIADLELIDEGFLKDMLVEAGNDGEKYADLPTQAQFDRF